MQQTAYHGKCIRDFLIRLVSPDVSRIVAGNDIGNIVTKAWDLIAEMSSSGITFKTHFPETSTKFTASLMEPVNSDISPMKLQNAGAKVRLVITPLVTLRDDRGTSIRCKNLVISKVLIVEKEK